MSVNANYIGNLNSPVSQVLAGATTVKIGSTIADNAQTLSAWSFANPTGGAVVCSLFWFDGTTEWLIWTKSVATTDTTIESNIPLRLRSGNEIRAKGAASIAVTLIYNMNIPNQNQ